MISKSIGVDKIRKQDRGITTIALVITIVLNCWRSGRCEYIKNKNKY